MTAFGAGNNAEIQFWIGGPDLDQLAKYSEVLLAKLKTIPGVVDADTNLVVGKPELGVHIDRAKAGDLGVRVQDVAATLNVLVGGLKVTDYYEGGEQYEVHLRAEADYRSDAAGHRAGDRALAARTGAPAGRGALRAGHRAVAGQPPRAPAAGAALRQHAARLLGAGDHGRAQPRRRRS